jgi:DNA-binding transcriptional LysR family regulator
MDWNKLRLFYFVAKEKSITKAAQELNVSQSALSRSILLLEHQMKISLFERTPKGVFLTLHGESLYKTINNIFVEIEAIRNQIKDDHIIPQGELKIATTPGIGGSWLMQYLHGFLSLYPGMRLTIRGNLEKVDLTKADAIIRTYMPYQPDLIQRRLTSFRMKFYASEKYLSQFGIPQTIDDLNNHNLILLDNDSDYEDPAWLLDVSSKNKAIKKPYLQVNSPEGLFNAVKEGLGIAELAEEYPVLKNSNLIQVLPDTEASVEVFYIYPAKLKNSKRITALADYLEECMTKSQNTKEL